MSPFKNRVIRIIQAIPHGRVVSYGQVAAYAGVPRAARQVGWILNKSEGMIELPWWRVINNEGRISIKGTKYNDRALQKKLLQAENITVSEELHVAMDKYRFIATTQQLQEFELPKSYIETIMLKYHL
jgi:methylated-DNA-protein-cysteine methyltransferase-like protein